MSAPSRICEESYRRRRDGWCTPGTRPGWEQVGWRAHLRHCRCTARYAGNADLAPTTAVRRVLITRIPTPFTVSVSAGTANYHAAVFVTAHLGKASAGQIVSVYALPFGSKSDHLLRIGLINPRGELSVRYVPSVSTTFTVDFWGNSGYQSATVKRIVYVRAGVGESISGYSASAYVGKTLYRVYEQTDTLNAGSTVAPHEKGCVAFQIEQNVSGPGSTTRPPIASS
jgi:hypothetical protein